MPAPVAPLSSLLDGLDGVRVHGDGDVSIAAITHDSRRVTPGSLFVAYRGVYQDVHAYIPDAVARGASAVIGERSWEDVSAALGLPDNLTYVRTANARHARSHVAAALFGHPSRDLIVVGVTGTDGKTTTGALLHAIVEAAGVPAGLVTTVEAQMGGQTVDTGLHTTTPEAEELQAYLADMRDAGIRVAVIEVTSHGLDQHRVSHVAFDVAVITNITHEALEYHETFEAYSRTKARLFHMVSEPANAPSASDPRSPTGVRKTAVLNAGDRSFGRLSRIGAQRRLTYAVAKQADFTPENVEHTADGLQFTAVSPVGRIDLRSALLGHYNVANILAACAAAHALDLPPDAWRVGVSRMTGIPGRMELIDQGQPFMAVVDFAHTPNALAHALDTARDLLRPAGRVIAVFGCAGLRDKSKRRLMGRAAGDKADLAVVTAEDPRTEDLSAILRAVAEGLTEAGAREGHEYILEPDRFRAIRRACEAARPRDVVIVLGKGHEQSMCFGTTEYPWDDRDAVRAALRGDERYGALPTTSAGP